MSQTTQSVAGDMVACARDLLGIPFRHRGRTRAGLDCAGVVYLARKQAHGIDIDFRVYPSRPTSQFVLDKIASYGTRIPIASATPGDVVVLRLGSFSTHLGVLTDGGVVHAMPGAGVVETPRTELSNNGSIAAAFRLPRFRWQR
jgi:cell wall-associated NlpC family hydrolase